MPGTRGVLEAPDALCRLPYRSWTDLKMLYLKGYNIWGLQKMAFWIGEIQTFYCCLQETDIITFINYTVFL